MKKTIIKYGISGFILLSCVFIAINVNTKHKDANDNQIVIVNGEHLVEFNDMDALVEYSDAIVTGKVISEESVTDVSTKYIFEINQSIKGKDELQQIDVYEVNDSLLLGKEYLLFLEYSENVLYPNRIYTSFDKTAITELVGEKIKSNNKILSKFDHKDDLIKGIKESYKFNYYKLKVAPVKAESTNMIELIEDATYIVKLVPTKVTEENKYVNVVEAEVLNQYKGQLTENISLILPSFVQVGTEYIVFLKQDEFGSFVITTKKSSILNRDQDKRWTEAINLLNK